MADYGSKESTRSRAGVFSHSQIRHLMRVEFGRAQRYGYPISYIQICVDRLDQLRDLYGYESKETILEDVVGLLQEETRGCDYLGKSTDDRLSVILPHTNQHGAEAVGQRLLEAARGLVFEADGRRLKVTLSVGAAHYEAENTLFFDALVKASEDALGAALSAGGDTFVYRDPGAV